MSLSVQLGLLLAVLTAFTSIAGFLYKFRGARDAPAVDMSRPVRSSVALFRSPLYALGIVIAMGSWGLHVGALALAPISLVQSVIAGGLVLLTVVADRLFGIAVTRREWIGVALDGCGPRLSRRNARQGRGQRPLALPRRHARDLRFGGRGGRPADRGPIPPRDALAVSAGLLWAASDTSIKALSGHLSSLGIGVLIHPLAFVILIASLLGLLISARSLAAR